MPLGFTQNTEWLAGTGGSEGGKAEKEKAEGRRGREGGEEGRKEDSEEEREGEGKRGREGGRASESIQFTSWLSCSHCYNRTANPDMTITGQQPPRELFQLLRVKNVNALETTVMINFLT